MYHSIRVGLLRCWYSLTYGVGMAKDLHRTVTDDLHDALHKALAARAELAHYIAHLEHAVGEPANPALLRDVRKAANTAATLVTESQTLANTAHRRVEAQLLAAAS